LRERTICFAAKIVLDVAGTLTSGNDPARNRNSAGKIEGKPDLTKGAHNMGPFVIFLTQRNAATKSSFRPARSAKLTSRR
jgi:hypothetical protein